MRDLVGMELEIPAAALEMGYTVTCNHVLCSLPLAPHQPPL